LADPGLELEFRCTDDASLFVAGSGTVATLTLDSVVPVTDGGLVVYCDVEGAPPDPVIELLSGRPDVTTARRIDGGDDAWTLEVTATGGSVLFPLIAFGADVRSLTAAEGSCSVIARVDAETDVRALTERVRESYPATELAAKRNLDDADGSDLVPRGSRGRAHGAPAGGAGAGSPRWLLRVAPGGDRQRGGRGPRHRVLDAPRLPPESRVQARRRAVRIGAAAPGGDDGVSRAAAGTTLAT
jgi:hypothetical protein